MCSWCRTKPRLHFSNVGMASELDIQKPYLFFLNTTLRCVITRLSYRNMMMQAQSQRTATAPIVSTSRIVATRCHPSKLLGASHSFATGTAVCARPVRKVTSRCQSQRVRADVFYTQKTVPDQTGRVAIVTGEPPAYSSVAQSQACCVVHMIRNCVGVQEAPPVWVLRWQSVCHRRMLL